MIVMDRQPHARRQPRQLTLSDLFHLGLAVSASFQFTHCQELAQMALTWPLGLFLVNVLWRLALVPLGFVICGLVVKSAFLA